MQNRYSINNQFDLCETTLICILKLLLFRALLIYIARLWQTEKKILIANIW